MNYNVTIPTHSTAIGRRSDINVYTVELSPLERLDAAGLLRLDGDHHDDDESLGVRIYRNFRESLLSGTLAVGDMLNTRPVAAALGVSTMPVREAMSRLVADGGLESLANRAFRVPDINTAQFRELYLMRLRLETLAAEHAAARATSQDLARISERFDAMVGCCASSVLGYLAAHRNFHFEIYRAAAMPLLFNAIETLWLRMGPVMNAGAELADVDEETGAHRDLMSALHRGDPGASAKAIDEDLRLAGERTTRFIAEREASVLDDSSSASQDRTRRRKSARQKAQAGA